MARNDIDGTGWLVENRDSTVVKAFTHTSAWDAATRHINMTANIVEIPRIDDMDVDVIPKGSAYGEDTSSAGVLSIAAKKFGKALRIAEEDVEDDKLADYLELKKQSASSSFAKKFDNAAIGTIAAANGVSVPFTSLYRALTTAEPNTGYSANANVATSNATNLGYDAINLLLGLVEQSDYYDETEISAIAHPIFKRLLRGIKDSTGRPIFFTDVVNGREIGRLLGVPIRWSNGARVSATATTFGGASAGGVGVKGTAGNPLLTLVNKPYAVTGDRKPFESVLIPGRDGLAGLTDEDILKVRARKSAGTTVPGAHAILELIA